MEVPLVRVVLTLLLICHQSSASEEIKNCTPAAVIKQARRTIYFQQNEDATLACIAKGDPTLTYIWLKDGEELDLTTPDRQKRLTITPGVGTLVFSPAKKEDAGVYQCKVQNPCGTSMSSKTRLLHAYIDIFPKLQGPQKEIAFLGKPLKLSCDPPKSVPEAQVRWILESEESEEEGPRYEEDSGMFRSVELGRRITMDYSGNLYFVSVEKGDEQNGMRYVCVAANNIVRSINTGSDKIIEIKGLTMTEDEDATLLQWHSPKEVLALEGRKAKFKCIFSGNPTPEVRWDRIDGGPFDPERMIQSEDEHEFVISDVTAEDAGKYACTGKNPSLRNAVQETFTLSVQSHPRWTKRPDDMVLGVEDNVTVVCDADADPKASIQWFINGVPIEEAPPAKNRRKQHNALVFTNLTQDDSQVIQCNASNIHGYLWTNAYLQVEAMPPSIMKKPAEQKVAKEQNITIACGVEGKPKPKVHWYKNDQKLLGSRYQIMPSGDLHINSVVERDSGLYHCIAKNRFGTARAEGNLVVREKTEIITPPSDDQVNQGQEAIFTCGAITDIEEQKRLQFVWLKDGVLLDTSDPRIDVHQGNLNIRDTTSRDSAFYTCVASNDLDSDQAVAKLEVIAPPDPPSRVTILSCMETQVDIEWEFSESQSNFSPLQEFIIEYSTEHHPDEWREARRLPADRRQMTYNMSPWATYTFRVRARNLMGLSEPSSPTHTVCQTPEARPYGNPQNVDTVEDRTGWLIIEWEPMNKMEHNSGNFHYIVTWQAKGADGREEGPEMSRVVDDWMAGRLEVEVGGIYQPYYVSVKAANAMGDAIVPPQKVTGHSGEDVPSVVPENFELDPDSPVTSTSAGFRWDPVDTSPENINGKFVGYKIRYWKKNQKDSTLYEELIIVSKSNRHRRRADDGKVRGQVSQLPSFSKIEADVVVVNTYFSSPGSNVVQFTTPEGVPSRVKYLEALFRGSSHFLLEWGPPVESNGVLIGYQLGYQRVDGLMLGELVIARDDLPVGQQRTTLDGLEPSSLYRIFISAKTAQGPGHKYYIDVRTTDDTSELAEPTISSIIPGEKEANVSFTLTKAQRGERTGSVYYLEYRKLGEHGWDREAEGATDHFWLTLEDLEPATTYEVRVVSVPKTADRNTKEFKPSTESRFRTSGISTKQGSFLSAAWFIGMMVAIALLLLILIVVCIVKRNRGKAYTFPPERDTVDGTPALFSEPPKSAKNGVNTGAPQEPEAEKMPLGEETDSMAEYGDDPVRFNEDGSFIGQYGDSKPPATEGPNPSGMSHIV